MKKLIEMIKTWIKRRQQAKKPVIYCVHGFGIRRTVEFEPLRTYFEKRGHQVVCVELFDQTNDLDIDPNEWFSRAQKGLETLIHQKRKVWLVGFSMGGVIASRLATLYPVERVVLLAPAFEYISLQTVINVAEKVARNVIKKPKVVISDYPLLPDHFTLVFRSIVTMCKESVNEVKVPVLFLHGSADETIPVRSSENAYAKIPHDQKLLLVVQEVNHRLLDDEVHSQDILKLIDDFFNQRLVKAINLDK